MANKKPYFFAQPILTERLVEAERIAVALQNAAGLIPDSDTVTRNRLVKAVDAHVAVVIPTWMKISGMPAETAKMPVRSVADKREVSDSLANIAFEMRHRVSQYIDVLRNLLEIQANLNARKPLWFETFGFNITSAFYREVHEFWAQSVHDFFDEALYAALLRTRTLEGRTAENVRLLLLVINCIKATTRGSRKTPAPVVEGSTINPTKRNELAMTLRRSAGPTMVALRRRLNIVK